MKILITGVAGFLGSHLSQKLSELGHDIVGIDNMAGGYKDNIPKNISFLNFDDAKQTKSNVGFVLKLITSEESTPVVTTEIKEKLNIQNFNDII